MKNQSLPNLIVTEEECIAPKEQRGSLMEYNKILDVVGSCDRVRPEEGKENAGRN